MRKTIITIAVLAGLGFLVFASARIILAADGPCSPRREPAPPKGSA